METNGWKSKAQVKSLQRICSQSHTLPTQKQQVGLQVLFCCVLITMKITQTASSSPSWSHSIKKVRTEYYSQQLNRFLRNILTVLLCHSPFQMSLMLNAHFLSFLFTPHPSVTLCVVFYFILQSYCSALTIFKLINIIFMTWFELICANLLVFFQAYWVYFNLNVAILTRWAAVVWSLSADVNVLGQWILLL